MIFKGFVDEEVKPKEEDPMSNEIIQQLIKDDSDGIKESSEGEEIENADPSITEQEVIVDKEVETKEESIECSDEKSNDGEEENEEKASEEEILDHSKLDICSTEKDTTHIERNIELVKPCKYMINEAVEVTPRESKIKDDDTDIDQDIIEDDDTSSEPHKPIIMDRRKTLDYSPSFKPSSKLLGKRQSIDPVRIKACGVSNVPDLTKKSTDYIPSEIRIPAIGASGRSIGDKTARPPSRKDMATPLLPPDQPRPFVTTPNPARNRALWEAPNLARLIASNEKSPGKRPDSAQSNSTSTTTTSHTLSLSEADSGVSDLSSGSRRSSGIFLIFMNCANN